ncbi:MAG: ComEC/Rec2 family competence protein [Chloroflexi bacterium]|nr:ComEC/Rec2 family competence protein [Chloroflexota bacterium]
MAALPAETTRPAPFVPGSRFLSNAAIAVTIGYCAGAATFDTLPPKVIFALGLAGLMAALAPMIWRLRGTATSPWLGAAALVGGLLALGSFAALIGTDRMSLGETARLNAAGTIKDLTGLREVRGLVADDPSPRTRSLSLTLDDVLVQTADGWASLPGRLNVSLPLTATEEYGDYLQLRGKLQPLSGNAGLVESLQRQDIAGSMVFPKVSYLANPQANRLMQTLFQVRRHLAQTIANTVPEPAAATMQAALLGEKGNLTKQEQQDLVDTGTVHLIAISGFKLTLLAEFLAVGATWLLRKTGWAFAMTLTVAVVTLVSIASYTLLSGATPSATRAAIMAGLVVLAGLVGRPRDQLSALAVAVFAIVAVRPAEVQDPGLQLSSLSVLGITLIGQPLARRFGGQGALREAVVNAFAVSLGATAFALPVLANGFHVISLVSPLANLIGMPLLAPIMVLGLGGAVLGSLFPPLGGLLLWPAWALTTGLQEVVAAAASLPNAALSVPELAPAIIAVYYLALAAAVWLLRRDRQPQSTRRSHRLPPAAALAMVTAGGAAVVVMAAIASQAPNAPRVTFLDVPGSAALIRMPAGARVLVDGGQNPAALRRELGRLLPPWDQRLDLIIATSPRRDFSGSLQEILPSNPSATFLAPDADSNSQSYRALLAGHPHRSDVSEVDLGGAVMRKLSDATWRLETGGGTVLFGDGGAAGADVVYSATRPAGQPLWVRPAQPGGSADEPSVDVANAGAFTIELEIGPAGERSISSWPGGG